MSKPVIRQARPGDLPQIKHLLEAESLPVAGVDDHLAHYIVAEISSAVIGSIGLEVYDDTALLRSAVVSRSEQGKGIGSILFAATVEQARTLGVQRLLLLTTTADKYFERKGFSRIDRQAVKGGVTTSVEFTSACPSTAVCMELAL